MTTTDLESRRRAEFAQYERPEYFGKMKPWRVAIIAEWLGHAAKARLRSYLDVGCGTAETRDIARALHFKRWQGCEVVASCCHEPDVDLIPGAHDLPYADDEFNVVTCNDVLEHVLEEDVPAALSEMARVARNRGFLGISQKPGKHHPTIKPTEWWWASVQEHMKPASLEIVYADRIPKIKQPYLWLDVRWN